MPSGPPSDSNRHAIAPSGDGAGTVDLPSEMTATEIISGGPPLLVDSDGSTLAAPPVGPESPDPFSRRGEMPPEEIPAPALPADSNPVGRRRRTSASAAGYPAVAGFGSGPASGPAAATLPIDESTFASALDALRHDEIRRTRLLARFGLIMAVSIAVALLFLPAEPGMTRLTYAAVAVGAVGSLWLYYLASRPDRYIARHVAIVWLMNSVAVSTGVICFGVFSAGAIVVSLGIYFLALGQNLPLALACYLTCAGIHGGMAGLLILGVIPDPGLIHTAYLPGKMLLILELLVQILLAAAFVMARASRRVTLSAVTDYERVVRALAQREALLHEARHDLERALQLGGVGRFSGQTLGSFRLGAVLGRGSMGEVYEAVRTTTGEPAAVKLLQPASMGNPSYLRRFLREVEVAATLEVPHVVRVLEVGDASSPLPYLAMERLRGQDLAQILRDQRRLDRWQVIELVDQAGRGITAAARAGVVHRDLKPQNLFLAQQPSGPPLWKVLDFGVSKLLGEHGTLTQGQVVGTPVYMAPEQARGLDVDERADLYALAAIAYRCITGNLPFRGKDVPTIMYQVVYVMPVRPSALCDVPEDVDDVLLIAMAKNAANRFRRAADLVGALKDGLNGRLSEELRRRAREVARLHPWRGRS